MPRFLFTLLVCLFCATFVTGCEDNMRSIYYDLGTFKHLGETCKPDVAPSSECGYAPQFYCTTSGVCASACNTSADCAEGAVCIGSGDMIVGECRLMASAVDGGQD